MKVLFSHSLPFFLAHGGYANIDRSVEARTGAWASRWSPCAGGMKTRPAILFIISAVPTTSAHRPSPHEKKFKVVMTDLLDQTASRGPLRLFLQRRAIRTIRRMARGLAGNLSRGIYKEIDAMVYAVGHEWEVAKYLFDANPQRGYVIPMGSRKGAKTTFDSPRRRKITSYPSRRLVPEKIQYCWHKPPGSPKFRLSFSASHSQLTTTIFSASRNWPMVKCQIPDFLVREEKISSFRGARGFALPQQIRKRLHCRL